MAQRLPNNEQVAFQQPTGGAPPNLGSVPVDNIIKAGAAIGQQVGAIIDGAVELEDFAYQQAAEIQLRNTQIQANLDVQERLQLPDGHERAFFDAKGNYKPVVMQNIIHQHGKSIASLSSLPMSAGRRLALAGKVAQVGLGMIESFTLAGLDTQRKRALGNFETNYRLALETGDYGGAEQAAYDGVKAGLYSEAQGNLLAFQARKKRELDRLDAMLIDSPRSAIALLNSGELDQYTTPAERSRIRKNASNVVDSVARQADRDALVFSAKDTEPFETDSETQQLQKRIAKSPLDSLPRGTAMENAHWQALLLNPDDQKARTALLNMAVLEASSQKPGAASEAARDEFVQRYTRFGIFSEGDIERIWKDGQAFIKEATSVSIDAKAHIEAFFKAGDVFNQEAHTAFMKELNAAGALSAPVSSHWWGGGKSGGGKIYKQYEEELRRRYPDKYGNGSDIPEDVVKVYAYNAWLTQHEAQKEAEIMTAYNAWRHTVAGKEASPLAQRTELDAICERVLGHKAGFVKYNETGQPIEDANDVVFNQRIANQNAAYDKFARANERTEAFEAPTITRPVMPFKHNVQVGFAEAGDKLNLNEIRLPASMIGAGVVVGESEMLIQAPSNGRQMLVKVVGTSESPQLSDELAVYLQAAPGETRPFDMKVVTPAVAERLRTIQSDRQRELPGQTSIQVNANVDLGGLGEYLEVFETAGLQNGVDPNLLLAIAMHETALGRSNAFLKKNNAMGISNASGPTYQTSVAEGVHRMAGLIGSSSRYQDWRRSGKLADLQKVYAPVGAQNDKKGQNQHWQAGVRKYYKQLTGKDLL